MDDCIAGSVDSNLLARGGMLGYGGADEFLPLKGEGPPAADNRWDPAPEAEAEANVEVEDDYHSWLCDDY
jgi:hypothetical protein